MTHVSLFSGAGISDYGFHLAGWECLAQVEIDRQANGVRKRHFPNVEHHEDVRSFDATKFRGVDAVIGGFPCQDYSVAGQRAGLAGDRGALWWEFHRVVRESRPRLVIGENVPGLLSADKGRSFGAIVTSLVELGYRVSWRVLDLRYFRVPQRRRRVFIVASLGDGRCAEILFEPGCLPRDSQTCEEAGEDAPRELARCLRGRSNATHREDSDTYIAHTLRGDGFDASEDGTGRGTPLVATTLTAGGHPNSNAPGRRREDDENLVPVAFGWAKSPSQTMQIAETTDALQASPNGYPAVAFTASEQANGFAWERDHYPCLNAQVPNDSSNIQHGVRQGLAVRRLTPRECERLMGLPDDFTRWDENGKEMADGPRYKMLGNGWSVPQAQWLAERASMVYAMREAA